MGEETPLVLVRVKYYGKGTKNRDWYSSNSKGGGDYLNYVDTGSKSGKYYDDYMQYAGNPEKSSGVFGNNGLMTQQEKKEMREALRKTDSKIWDMVISFEELYGKSKMKSWKDAKSLLVKELPRFFKDNDMPYENMNWFAGMHENSDNRHIHLCFFEKEPTKWKCKHSGRHWHKGKLKVETMNDFKLHIYQSLEQTKSSVERKNVRNAINETILSPEEFSQKFKGNLLEVYRRLPPKGSDLRYGSIDMTLALPYIDRAIQNLFDSSPRLKKIDRMMREELTKRDEITIRYCKKEKMNPDKYLELPKYDEDIKRRLGNQIIHLAIEASKQEVDSHCKASELVRQRWNEKKKRSYLFKKAVQLSTKCNEEADNAFNDWINRMRKAQKETIREQGMVFEENELY